MREEYLSRYGALTSEGQSGVYLPGGADSDSAEANDPMEAEAPSRAYLLALHGHESAPSAPVVDKSGATVGLYSEPGGLRSRGDRAAVREHREVPNDVLHAPNR